MIKLCPPAIIYVIFSLVQIILDTLKGLYNTAFMKSVVMIMVTFLLNILCEGGLTIISWIIVFIPFMLMTVIVTMLLYIFGLNATTGSVDYTCKNYPNNVSVDENGNIIVYYPTYDYVRKPAFYKAPNIYIPNPTTDASISNNPMITQNIPTWVSSSPAYQS